MIVGITMVKDELDIVESTVNRMLDQVDRVIVADNGSTDGTLDALYAIAEHRELDVLEDRDPAYYQSRKMTALAAAAQDAGADWVIPFDADEVWKCRRGDLRAALATVPADVQIVTADLYDHVPTALDEIALNGPAAAMQWRRPAPAPLPKVACRTHPDLVIEQGNHGASYYRTVPLRLEGLLTVRHFPYRSVEQMIRKARNGAAAYAATDLPEHVGQHWRDYGRLSDEQIGDTFRKWFWSADPQADGLVHDPA